MPARSFRPETPMQLYISYETVPFIRERHTGEQRHTHIGPLTRDAARAAGSVMRRAVRSERRKDPRGGEPRCERHCRRTREQFRCTRARENKLPSGSNSLTAGLQPSCLFAKQLGCRAAATLLPLEDQTPTEALAFCVWGICFVLFWGPLGLVAAQCAVCEGAAWVAVCGDCLAVPPARPCARLSVWGCRLALRCVVGLADAPRISGGAGPVVPT